MGVPPLGGAAAGTAGRRQVAGVGGDAGRRVARRLSRALAVEAPQGLDQALAGLAGARHATQHRLRIAEVPTADVRPEVDVGDALVPAEHEGEIAAAVAIALELDVADDAEGQVDGHRQRDAELHDDATIGDRVDGHPRVQPGEEREDAGRDHPHRHVPHRRRGQLRERAALADDDGGLPQQQQGEVEGDLVGVEGPPGQGAPVRRTLPEDLLAGREPLRETPDRLVVVFPHRHSSGSARSSVL
jgi:hypothetical protein